ncbi:hypothetical protein QBC35DRAFT_505564 [Podospora australis]|uniref:Uncharacterized protein n=1 Tax=Podospora australis TaxID=1536484 RepID=A0AAN7AFF2_9PEZI|nr:hypothetical protein QBC35DRAFT_505564 [Podospora australis]
MSWSALPDSYVHDALQQGTHFSGLDGDSKRVGTFRKLDVWELLPGDEKKGFVGGWAWRACHPDDLEPGITRLILAPYPSSETAQVLSALLLKLHIPSEFALERPCSVTHSIGSREDEDGFTAAWFQTLTKNIQKKGDKTNLVQNVVARADRLLDPEVVPGTDETWTRSGYCLSVPPSPNRCPTLVCFSAPRNVLDRLDLLRETCLPGSNAEREIKAEPYALFDLVIYGSFGYIDERVWRMCDRVYPIEKRVLLDASQAPAAVDSQRNKFALLHNCSKQITHLRETVDGFLLLTEELSNIVRTRKEGVGADAAAVRKRLMDNLRHRKSLFNNLRLRLSSLQRRVDNSTGLEFNLVTLQDSLLMRRDASSMKIIAAITMVFLPTTAVASIVGSQLFNVSFSEEHGTWDVQASPLFKILWAVATPLTVLVIAMSAGWNTLMERRRNQRQFAQATGT